MGGNTTLSSQRGGIQGGLGSLWVADRWGWGKMVAPTFSVYEKPKRNLRSSGWLNGHIGVSLYSHRLSWIKRCEHAL